jgi:hypothetical protein
MAFTAAHLPELHEADGGDEYGHGHQHQDHPLLHDDKSPFRPHHTNSYGQSWPAAPVRLKRPL